MSIEVVNSAIKWKETISKLPLSTKISTLKNSVEETALTTTTVTTSVISSDNLIINAVSNTENGKIAGNQKYVNDLLINNKISEHCERKNDNIENILTKCKIINDNKFEVGGSCKMLNSSSPDRSITLPPIPELIPIRKSFISGSSNKKNRMCSSSLKKKDLNLIEKNNIVEEKKDIDEDGFVINKIYVEKKSNNDKNLNNGIDVNYKNVCENIVTIEKINHNNDKKTNVEIENKKFNNENKMNNNNNNNKKQIRLKISYKQDENDEKNNVLLKNLKTENKGPILENSDKIEVKNKLENSDSITPIMPQSIMDNHINQTDTSSINDLIKTVPIKKKRGRRPKIQMLTSTNQQSQFNSIEAQNQTTTLDTTNSFVEPSSIPVVQNRKSDRRRMPRDIYFFFEQPRSNKKGKGNKKKSITNRRISKTNTKSNVNKSITSLPSSSSSSPPISSSSSSSLSLSKQSQICEDYILNTTKKPSTTTNTKYSIKNMKKESQNNDVENTTTNNCVPKVNPIFLWIKQDNTRIIEVRCEDYDKRNRIKITKTPNGWRATPRTDPTTSRVVKLLPNPLVRIKPEFQRSNLLDIDKDDKFKKKTQNKILKQCVQSDKPRLKVKSYPSFENTLKLRQHKNKKKKKKKKKHDNEMDKINNDLEDPAKSLLENEEIRELLSNEPKDVIVYESINHEQAEQENQINLSSSPPPILLQEMNIEKSNISIPSLKTFELSDCTSVTPNALATKSNNLSQQNDNEVDLNSISLIHELQNDPPQPSQQQIMLCSQQQQQTDNIFSQTNPQTQSTVVVNALTTSHSLSTDHIDLTIDNFDPSDVVCKDLLDDPDLMQHCGDNGMNGITGEELIDSLMKRGCEDNNISDIVEDDEINCKPSQQKQEKQNFKDQQFQQFSYQDLTKDINSMVPTTTICLDDFDNEDDDLLMQPEPVEDIITRLGESLTDSPKCLSFNEAGEIEGLHGELFQTSNQQISFNPATTLDELSITIKDLEKSSESCLTTVESTTTTTTTAGNVAPTKPDSSGTTTMVSPDSCVADELPKDLTCKKSNSIVNSQQPERVLSRNSDAIQSPQPSGLPAVPPSPDLVHSRSITTSKTVFLNQISRQESSSPKVGSSITPIKSNLQSSTTKSNVTSTQQKEPLDLGKYRKSASPTITCSEEANKKHLNKNVITIDDDNDNISCEPLEKRIKMESMTTNEGKNHTETLIEMLSSGNDPDPLTQLRLLINNSEWKVPDPILVPKDRLSAVLMSPAREIPLLLTTRPELRLPEAFAYPAILQDPNILVISLAQLETILQKHIELINKTKAIANIPQTPVEPVSKPRIEKSKVDDIKTKKNPEPVITKPMNMNVNPLTTRSASNCLANEIDAATMAAFNQMLWLPYLGQMAPELFKAMANFPKSSTYAELFSYLNQQVQVQQQYQQQQQQQQQQHQKQSDLSSPINPSALPFQNSLEFAMWQEALNQMQLKRSMAINNVTTLNHQKEQQQKKTEDLKANNLNFNLQSLFNQKSGLDNSGFLSELQKSQGKSARTTNEQLRKTQQNHMLNKQNLSDKNTYNLQHKSISSKIKQQQQQSHNHQLSSSSSSEQKPRVTCKSLSNLLQPERLADTSNTTNSSSLIDNKMTNLMAMPSFDFSSPGGLHHHHHQRAQQSLHQLQAAAISQQANSQSHQSQFNPNHLSTTATAVASVNNDVMGCNNSFLNGNYIPNNTITNSGMYHQHQTQQQQQQQHQQHQHQNKVKSKSNSNHLLNANAMQRRLLNCENMTEMGNFNTNFDELMNDPTAHLWHPLFGSHQKSSYNSPWHWTTVTATGE